MDAESHPDPYHGKWKRIPTLETADIARRTVDLPYANLSAAQRPAVYWPSDKTRPYQVLVHIRGSAVALVQTGWAVP